MQDNHPQPQPAHPIRLIASHAASAMVIGLCAALPATGVTYLIALGASCISTRGCETPTIVDALVPIVAIGVWAVATLATGSRHLRTAQPANPDVWRMRFSGHIEHGICAADLAGADLDAAVGFEHELTRAFTTYLHNSDSDRKRRFLMQINTIDPRLRLFRRT